MQERTRTRVASALTGAALIAGLWAASAAPVGATPSLSAGCTELNNSAYDTTRTFGGFYVTGALAFTQGEVISATGTTGGGPFTPQLYIYSPAYNGGAGLISNQAGTSGTPITYTIPSDGTYEVYWGTDALYYSTPSWVISCDNGSTPPPPADTDADGVADTADLCADTTLPDSLANRDPKRYATNASGTTTALSGKNILSFSMADTHGCSAKQIAVQSGIGGKSLEKGLPLATLQAWLASHTT